MACARASQVVRTAKGVPDSIPLPIIRLVPLASSPYFTLSGAPDASHAFALLSSSSAFLRSVKELNSHYLLKLCLFVIHFPCSSERVCFNLPSLYAPRMMVKYVFTK